MKELPTSKDETPTLRLVAANSMGMEACCHLHAFELGMGQRLGSISLHKCLSGWAAKCEAWHAEQMYLIHPYGCV